MELKAGRQFGGALGIDPCGREGMERKWTEEEVCRDTDPRAVSARHMGAVLVVLLMAPHWAKMARPLMPMLMSPWIWTGLGRDDLRPGGSLQQG